MSQQAVSGIDAIETYIPRLYIDTKDFAGWRKEDPEKLSAGLGLQKVAVTDSNQDPATMAANAVLKLMQKNNLRPKDIGRLSVATETSLDESKALNPFVIGMLNQVYGQDAFSHVGGVESKFACVSGIDAINTTSDLVSVGRMRGKSGVVVTTDIAKYDLYSAGEQTQGAGAVALLIKENPRLIAINPRMSASDTGDVYDFYRPTGKETPYVQGDYSRLEYVIRIGKAYKRLKKNIIEDKSLAFDPKKEPLFEHIDLFSAHNPYPGMPKILLATWIVGELRGGFKPHSHPLPGWEDVREKLGGDDGGDPPEVSLATKIKIFNEKRKGTLDLAKLLSEDEAYLSNWKNYISKIKKLPIYQRLFKEKLESSLQISKIVGNLYTGSLPMGIRSMLEFEYKKNTDLTGKLVLMAGYGSGSQSLVSIGKIQAAYFEPASKMNIEEEIGPRRKLTLEEYEFLHRNLRSPENPLQDYRNEFILVSVKGDDEKFPKRKYAFNGEVSEVAYIRR